MATKRGRTYRRDAFASQPNWCAVCGATVDLQADHVQRLADNGPDDWVQLLCPTHHKEKSKMEQKTAKKGKGSSVVVADQSGGWRIAAGAALVMGAALWVLWTLGYQWQSATVAAVAVIIGAGVAFLAHRAHERDRVRRGLVVAVAKATNTPPLELRLTRLRWRRGVPASGIVRYSGVFDDHAGSKGRMVVEELLRRKTGARGFLWDEARNRVAWSPDRFTDEEWEVDQVDVPGERDVIAARLRTGIESVLKTKLVAFTVDQWHDTTPTTFVATYDAKANVHQDLVQDAVEDKVETLLRGHGSWRATWDTSRDRVTFTDTPDPLADTVYAGDVADTVDLAAVTLGVRDDGHPWTLPLFRPGRGATHVLIAGAAGSGKGSVIWSLVRGLAPAAVTGHVELWGADPKGGMELGKGRDCWARYADTIPGIVALLEAAVQVMQDRSARLAAARQRVLTPTPAEPLIVIVVDEIAALTTYAGDAKQRAHVAQCLGLLLSQGRAPGVSLVGAVQDPRKEVLNRDLFLTRIALRCTEATQPDMILGGGSRAQGAKADRIAADQPGVGFMVVDGVPQPMRVRTAWVTDEQIEQLEVQLTAVRPPAGPVWEPAYPHELNRGDVIQIDVNGSVVEAEFDSCDEVPDAPHQVDVSYVDEDGQQWTMVDTRHVFMRRV